MPTQTTHYQKAVADNQNISSQLIYDALMQEIEPDLTSENIKYLDEIYKDESQEDRTRRLHGYEMAFEILEECIKDLEFEYAMSNLRQKEADPFALSDNDQNDEKDKAIEEIEEQIDSTDFRA